jgi:CspA family cold shock protein
VIGIWVVAWLLFSGLLATFDASVDALSQRHPICAYPKSGSETIGTVRWYNAARGFGYIRPDDGSADVYLHVSALGGMKVKPCDRVRYVIADRRAAQSVVRED